MECQQQQLAGWNQPCLEEHLAEIATSITEWREISPFLGLTEAEEHEILGAVPPLSVRSQKIAMLRLWKKKKGIAATYNQLCRALRKSGCLGLEDKMMQIFAESNGIIEDVDAGVPTISGHYSDYRSYLRELYKSMSHSHTSQHWTHLSRCEFIQLAMIGDEEVRHGGPEEEMIRLAQQGRIETILGRKENIGLNQLFDKNYYDVSSPPPPPPSPLSPSPLMAMTEANQDQLFGLDLLSLHPHPRTVLVEGAPGGGKSTLALHICHQWAQGASWLARFDVVVLAYLRDKAIQDAVSLADILPAPENFKSSQSQSIVSQIQSSYGKDILFIFDGWDEFPPNLMNESFVSTIIHQPHKLSLHRSTVLITSRPVSSGNLLNIVDRRVEILGFTQQQIHEYIHKSLDGNSTRVQKLVRHLKQYPVIEGYCYVPLHVAILVHIFLTMKEALPTTLHELFCSLVLCCIVREQVTREPKLFLPEFASLDDLPNDLKSKLKSLSILAYNGVMQDKVIFYSKDLQVSSLPTDIPSLGLLQAVEGLTLYSKSLSYNFLHLSVQELLAAYNISLMDPGEQVQVFKELFDSSRFQAVLHYYCGFTKLDNPDIQAFISSFQIGKLNFEDLLPLLHCFFEAQKPLLCQLVDPRFIPSNVHKKLDSKNLTPVDFLVAGYFISSLLSISTAKPIQLVIESIDDHRLKLLLNEFSFKKMSTSAVGLSLQLCSPFITAQGLSYLVAHLKNSSAIRELVISNADFYNDDDILFLIAEAMMTNSSVINLRLFCMRLHCTENDGSALVRMLQVNKSLTHLNLSANNIFDLGACCLFEGLWHNSTLVNLNLSNTGLTINIDTARLLTRMLRVNNSLTHLDLSDNEISNVGFRCIFKGLQHNTTLMHLSLSKNLCSAATNPDITKSLTKMLHANTSLTHIDISNNEISNSGARCIFKSLQHNTTLVNLNLSKTGITATNHLAIAKSLSKMLEVNKSLTHLNLSENDVIPDSGAYSIFDSLQHNTTLVYLNLCKTGIAATNPVIARSLMKLLQENKSLTHLDLSENSAISDTGAYYIFAGLQSNTTVVNLNLSKTGIAATNPSMAKSLTKMLCENKSLTHLDLSRNYIFSDSGAHCIFEGLQQNTTLVHLNLGSSRMENIDPDTAISLPRMLLVNKSLTHLDLSYCFMDAVSNRIISLIFDGLEDNTSLRYLDLNVGSSVLYIHADAVGKHIAPALKTNCSLQTLNIAGWMLLGNGVDIFLQSLMSNSTLQTLYVTYLYIDRETLFAFKKAREVKNLPPIDIHPYSSWESEFKLEIDSEMESAVSESDSDSDFDGLETESDSD